MNQNNISKYSEQDICRIFITPAIQKSGWENATQIREQVKRNIERFPQDFMFQLNEDEVDFMVSQNAIPSKQHLGGHLPYVFTEQDVDQLDENGKVPQLVGELDPVQ